MKQQLKKAKAKCDMYKEKAKAYKKRYANLLLTMNDVKEQLSCEKRDVSDFKLYFGKEDGNACHCKFYRNTSFSAFSHINMDFFCICY